MTRTLAAMWQSLVNSLPVYSRRDVDNAHNIGFIAGSKSCGIGRDNSGRFISLKRVADRTPVGQTRRLFQ